MKNDLSGVKVGDRLWSASHGWGTVRHTDKSPYPMQVTFEHRELIFTAEGKLNTIDELPILFWDEIKFEYPKKPLPDLAVDTRLIVSSNNGVKYKRYFSHFDKDGRCYCFRYGRTSWTESLTEYCDTWELYEEQK